jgi:hypothetical protein
MDGMLKSSSTWQWNIPATPVGPGRICCTKLWDFSVRCRTWMLNSWRCLCRSPTSCCTRRNSASRAAVVLVDTESGTRGKAGRCWDPRHEACSFWRRTTSSCSNLAFSATVSSSFCKNVIRANHMQSLIFYSVVSVIEPVSEYRGNVYRQYWTYIILGDWRSLCNRKFFIHILLLALLLFVNRSHNGLIRNSDKGIDSCWFYVNALGMWSLGWL